MSWILYVQNRALRGCSLVLKNRKTAHQNRFWCQFWNFLLSRVVAVLEVQLQLWYYRKNHGCIPNKGGCLKYRSNCILYRGKCLMYKGGYKFTAVVAYLKNMRFWRLNHNRGFVCYLAVLVRLRCYFCQMWLAVVCKKWHAQGSSSKGGNLKGSEVNANYS